ncbi:PREDICTED: uncharacterized protein LOC109126191 [Camelina sativa]|uniref:Uncharacterized protein LOC109126191 n=1 Tax=Camelina sativa TaxID=90675 RepID=A0ABM1QDS9_CAMSA|nr:PREDICTED: uncharacterized protein LOC109126191 [Camelina sativa]
MVSTVFSSSVDHWLTEESQEPSTTLIKSSNEVDLSFSQEIDRVWEPGGLPTKLELWDCPEKESSVLQVHPGVGLVDFRTAPGIANFLVLKEPVHVKEMESSPYPHKLIGSSFSHNKKLKTKCIKSWRFKFKISLAKTQPRLPCFIVDGFKAARIYHEIIGSWIDEQAEQMWSKMNGKFECNENVWFYQLVSDNGDGDVLNLNVHKKGKMWLDNVESNLHFKEFSWSKEPQGMTFLLLEVSTIEFVEYETYIKGQLVTGLMHLIFARMKLYLKHKWKSRLLQSFSGLELEMNNTCGCGLSSVECFMLRHMSFCNQRKRALNEVYSAGFESEEETIRNNFKGLSRLEKCHKLLSLENLSSKTWTSQRFLIDLSVLCNVAARLISHLHKEEFCSFSGMVSHSDDVL